MSKDLNAAIHAAEREMARKLRHHLGSAEEQHQRLEAKIEALFHPGDIKGIDRRPSPWWKLTARR